MEGSRFSAEREREYFIFLSVLPRRRMPGSHVLPVFRVLSRTSSATTVDVSFSLRISIVLTVHQFRTIAQPVHRK